MNTNPNGVNNADLRHRSQSGGKGSHHFLHTLFDFYSTNVSPLGPVAGQ